MAAQGIHKMVTTTYAFRARLLAEIIMAEPCSVNWQRGTDPFYTDEVWEQAMAIVEAHGWVVTRLDRSWDVAPPPSTN